MSTPALKEWSAAVHAMLDGRQTVLLRKGGIGEKRFALDASEFVFFPTIAHGHAERVRPEHRELIEVAAPDSTDAAVVIRAGARVVAAVSVNQPERIDEIQDLHIWTPESVQAERLDFRPRHRLTVLVVSARPLRAPLPLERILDYAGCTSWVDLPVRPDWGEPVHDADALRTVADRVRASVG